ncbi:hypothetical protein C922_05449 [Plasmodium inui San Antonio 1]|uniref:Uncharacterized protein n=1 Tax=Plasmodium inui San Antonio 1 TaxID=1237626 RepID=W6ZXX8_9APIC|nr:hypothetical protein C922_05449 [Plasmodium inui San Antonio 1]EUD64168.1 hypothetical protein C922_05449 [Plasmodium inui San Antonio 1]
MSPRGRREEEQQKQKTKQQHRSITNQPSLTPGRGQAWKTRNWEKEQVPEKGEGVIGAGEASKNRDGPHRREKRRDQSGTNGVLANKCPMA